MFLLEATVEGTEVGVAQAQVQVQEQAQVLLRAAGIWGQIVGEKRGLPLLVLLTVTQKERLGLTLTLMVVILEELTEEIRVM
jgi:hypothetical protein